VTRPTYTDTPIYREEEKESTQLTSPDDASVYCRGSSSTRNPSSSADDEIACDLEAIFGLF
jgi:hypothetical protein